MNTIQNVIEYKNLPSEVKEKIKSTLYMYDEANVIFECGKYHVSAHHALTATHSDDFAFIGNYSRDQVYSKAQQEENRRIFEEETKNMDWEWFGK